MTQHSAWQKKRGIMSDKEPLFTTCWMMYVNLVSTHLLPSRVGHTLIRRKPDLKMRMQIMSYTCFLVHFFDNWYIEYHHNSQNFMRNHTGFLHTKWEIFLDPVSPPLLEAWSCFRPYAPPNNTWTNQPLPRETRLNVVCLSGAMAASIFFRL